MYVYVCVCVRSCDVTPSFLSIVIGLLLKCARSGSCELKTLGARLEAELCGLQLQPGRGEDVPESSA